MQEAREPREPREPRREPRREPQEPQAHLGQRVQGRRIFFLGAGLLLLVSLVIAVLRFGDTGSPIGFIRLGLTGALLWAVWRGAGWARLLLSILLVLGAVLALLRAAGADQLALRLVLLGMGGVNAAFAGALWLSDPLRAFLTRAESSAKRESRGD